MILNLPDRKVIHKLCYGPAAIPLRTHLSTQPPKGQHWGWGQGWRRSEVECGTGRRWHSRAHTQAPTHTRQHMRSHVYGHRLTRSHVLTQCARAHSCTRINMCTRVLTHMLTCHTYSCARRRTYETAQACTLTHVHTLPLTGLVWSVASHRKGSKMNPRHLALSAQTASPRRVNSTVEALWHSRASVADTWPVWL